MKQTKDAPYFFIQTMNKKCCIAGTMEHFFEEEWMKKDKQIGLFCSSFWYKTDYCA